MDVSWTIKKAECRKIDALKKTLQSPLDSKEIKPINPKGNQSWLFTGRTDTEAEAPILWPPDGKNWPTGKDPDAEKDWRQEEKGTTEGEMVGWNHQLHGYEFEQAPGHSEGQGSLVCCSLWGCKVRHDWATELNWMHLWPHLDVSYAQINHLNQFKCLNSFVMLGRHQHHSYP